MGFDTYGLWPGSAGGGVRWNNEIRDTPKSSRFYYLNKAKEKKLQQKIDEPQTYSLYSNNCASWASSVVKEVTGEKLDVTEFFVFRHPRKLSKSIRKMEKKAPTTELTEYHFEGARALLDFLNPLY